MPLWCQLSYYWPTLTSTAGCHGRRRIGRVLLTSTRCVILRQITHSIVYRCKGPDSTSPEYLLPGPGALGEVRGGPQSSQLLECISSTTTFLGTSLVGNSTADLEDSQKDRFWRRAVCLLRDCSCFPSIDSSFAPGLSMSQCNALCPASLRTAMKKETDTVGHFQN